MPLFDSFLEASIRARIINIACLLFTFLACVGCCVGFAGDLFAVSFPAGDGTAHWTFYQSFIQTDANRIEFSGPNCVWSFCDTCLSGGKGFLALQIMSFVVLLALGTATMFRIAGGVAIIALSHPSHSLLLEGWACLAATVFYFFSVIAFGSSCYHAAQGYTDFQVKMTGFAFVILCFFFLFLELILLYFIRRSPSCHLGYQTSHAPGHERFVDGQDEEDARMAEEEAAAREKQREWNRSAGHAHADEAGYGNSGYQSASEDHIRTSAPPQEALATRKERAQR